MLFRCQENFDVVVTPLSPPGEDPRSLAAPRGLKSVGEANFLCGVVTEATLGAVTGQANCDPLEGLVCDGKDLHGARSLGGDACLKEPSGDGTGTICQAFPRTGAVFAAGDISTGVVERWAMGPKAAAVAAADSGSCTVTGFTT